MELLRHPVDHAERLDKLQVLEGLLIKDRAVAGHVLVLPLELPHLFGRIPGGEEGNGRAHEGNERHPRVVLHNDDKSAAETDEGSHHIWQESQDGICHHARIPVDPVEKVAGAVLGQRLPVGPKHLLVDVPPDLVGDFQPHLQGQPGLHRIDEDLGHTHAHVSTRHPDDLHGVHSGDGVHQVLADHRGPKPQHGAGSPQQDVDADEQPVAAHIGVHPQHLAHDLLQPSLFNSLYVMPHRSHILCNSP